MRVHGQKIEGHVARHQLYVHGGHTRIKWIRVKGWWILQYEDKARRACRTKKKGLRQQKNGERRKKKDAKSCGMCRRKGRNCTDKIWKRSR
jgi:hypothetical protein